MSRVGRQQSRRNEVEDFFARLLRDPLVDGSASLFRLAEVQRLQVGSIQMQHLGHLRCGATGGACIGHRQRHRNTGRGKKQIALLLANPLIEVEGELIA